MSGKQYFPNNWQKWKDAPEELFMRHTYNEIMDFKIAAWELPSNVCCVIRESNLDTKKVKEYVYQKHHAAKNKVRQLMLNNSEFIVCTDSELQFVKPHKDDEFDFD